MTLHQAAWLALGLDAAMIIYTLLLFVRGGLGHRTAIIIGSAAAIWLVVLRALFSNGEPFTWLLAPQGIRVFFGAPMAYVAEWRMTIAAQLLSDTDLSVQQVAERVGYTAQPSFTRSFTRHYGTAPRTYRSQVPRGDRPAR